MMFTHRLILYAHGSKDPRWRQPFERLAGDLQAELGQDAVRLAYMEFVLPTLQEVTADAVRDGVRRLSVLPLFMASGAHLANDLPQQVGAMRSQFSLLEVKVLPPVGEDPRLAAVLYAVISEVARRNAL